MYGRRTAASRSNAYFLPMSIGSGAPRKKSRNLPSRWPSSSVARSLEPAKAFLAPGAELKDLRSISRANGLANRRSCRARFSASARSCCAFASGVIVCPLAATAFATRCLGRPGLTRRVRRDVLKLVLRRRASDEDLSVATVLETARRERFYPRPAPSRSRGGSRPAGGARERIERGRGSLIDCDSLEPAGAGARPQDAQSLPPGCHCAP
jgi:hypothetical protein